jgi:hypothetical protein
VRRWNRIDRDMPTHPKIIALAAAFGWDPQRAVGFYVELLGAVGDYAPDGDITSWSPDMYERLGATRGMSRADREYLDIIEILLKVGLLDRVNGRLIVHGWVERNGTAWAATQRRGRGNTRGGKARARTAARDVKGRMLPRSNPGHTFDLDRDLDGDLGSKTPGQQSEIAPRKRKAPLGVVRGGGK